MPAVGAMSGGSLALCVEKLVPPLNLPPPPGPRPHKPFRARLGPPGTVTGRAVLRGLS
jgi:hypothetical protein